MRETWPFEREYFNWFSGDSFFAYLRNSSIPTKYIRNVITFNKAIQISEDFKMAERAKHDPLKGWDYEWACPFLWPKFNPKHGL